MHRAEIEGMRTSRTWLFALVMLAVLLGSAASARADESLEAAERVAAVARATAIRESGRTASELEVGLIDPRLRLRACDTEPTGRLTPGTRSSTQLTVEVRCPGPPWRQFVPVRIHAEEPVVIAARPLGRLEVVTAADVTLVRRDLAGLPSGYFRSVDDVVGRIAQRTIGSGEVLSPSTARRPPLVRRGQTVTLIARAGGLAVRSAGVVQGDGGLDERVRVRNSASGRTVEGFVRSSDTVEVRVE